MKSWKLSVSLGLAALLGLAIAWTLLGAATIVPGQPSISAIPVLSSSPIDGQWWEGQSLTAATAAPYQPATISSTLHLAMHGYTGLVVRARYPRAQTLTTAAVVYAWGLKGGHWAALRDTGGSQAITLDDAASDVDDGLTFKWTAPSNQIDAIGCTHVVVTVGTPAVASGGGAVSLELTRF